MQFPGKLEEISLSGKSITMINYVRKDSEADFIGTSRKLSGRKPENPKPCAA